MMTSVVAYVCDNQHLCWISLAPPTQGTWRSNDYVNALRLVDGWLSMG